MQKEAALHSPSASCWGSSSSQKAPPGWSQGTLAAPSSARFHNWFGERRRLVLHRDVSCPRCFFFYVLLIQARQTVAGLLPSAQIKASDAECSEHPQNHQWAESEWRSGPFKPPVNREVSSGGNAFSWWRLERKDEKKGDETDWKPIRNKRCGVSHHRASDYGACFATWLADSQQIAQHNWEKKYSWFFFLLFIFILVASYALERCVSLAYVTTRVILPNDVTVGFPPHSSLHEELISSPASPHTWFIWRGARR